MHVIKLYIHTKPTDCPCVRTPAGMADLSRLNPLEQSVLELYDADQKLPPGFAFEYRYDTDPVGD